MYNPKIDFAYGKMQELLVGAISIGDGYEVKKKVVKGDAYEEKTITEYEVLTKGGKSRGKVVFSKGTDLEKLIDISGLDLTKINEEDPLVAFIVDSLSRETENTFNTQLERYDSLMEKAGDYLSKFIKEIPGDVSDKQRLEEYASVKISEFAFDEYKGPKTEKEAGKELIDYVNRFMKDLPEELKEVEWIEGYAAKFFGEVVFDKYEIKFIPKEYSLGCLTEEERDSLNSLEEKGKNQKAMNRLKTLKSKSPEDFKSGGIDAYGEIILK